MKGDLSAIKHPIVDRAQGLIRIDFLKPALAVGHQRSGARRRRGKAFPYRARAMVEVTNAFQPLAQRQRLILPSDLVDEIDATTSRLRRKSVPDQLRNDFLVGEVEDRAVFVLDLLIGLIDQVENRMGIHVRGKYILQAVNL